MNKVERLTATLLLLQARPRTAAEIARHFEVSTRTVMRDVQALCEMGVPVAAREGPGGGYSLPADYGLTPLPLTTHEVFLMRLALGSLAQWADVPFAPELASLLAKLEASMPSRARADAEGLLQGVVVELPRAGVRAPFLEALMAASRDGAWVEVTYQSGTEASVQRLRPLAVSTRGGLWYCRAYSHTRGEERTYRVDRISALAPAENPLPGQAVPASPAYDAPEHPEIHATLTARGASYVEGEPHLSRALRRAPDGSASLTLRCPSAELDWYARYFAGLGGEVRVHAPAALRARLRTLGAALVERYSERIENA